LLVNPVPLSLTMAWGWAFALVQHNAGVMPFVLEYESEWR
jgi:hypothetical protein